MVVIVVVIVSTTHDDLEGAPRAAETCVGRGVGIRVRAGTASHQRDRLMGGVSGGMGVHRGVANGVAIVGVGFRGRMWPTRFDASMIGIRKNRVHSYITDIPS